MHHQVKGRPEKETRKKASEGAGRRGPAGARRCAAPSG